MRKITGCLLSCAVFAMSALLLAGPGIAASQTADGARILIAKRTTPASYGFQRLNGPQIQRLVVLLGKANYPDADPQSSNGNWTIFFKKSRKPHKGKADFATPVAENFGIWFVKRDRLCVRIKGGDSGNGVLDQNVPHNGCMEIYVHPKKGEVVAYIRPLRMYHFLMAEDAKQEIAEVLPRR